MRFNFLSSFALGMLVTTAISGAVYYHEKTPVAKASSKPTVVQKTVKVSLTDDEMKSKLSTAGYVVETKAEHDKALKDAQVSVQKPAAPAAANSNKTITRVVLNVTDGMTSGDIGAALLKSGIIHSSAVAFEKNIEGRGLQNHLRPGVYVVDSTMNYNQVVSTIFK